jgi:hypothetical protein
MATKKKPGKKVADKCPQEIVITGTGPNEQFTYLDPGGNKHHRSVFWQALDLGTQYQIVLGNPPLPFANGNGPFPTDATTGRTIPLTIDSSLKPGNTVYSYTVQPLSAQSRRGKRGKRRKGLSLGGGGIIIDS